MSNCILAFPNYIDSGPPFATVQWSGGSWQAALPLSNLAHPLLSKVARSADMAPASTCFTVDLGLARGVRVFAIPKTNGSRNATWRVRGFADAGLALTVCDSGVRPLYDAVYPPGTYSWGDPRVWDPRLTEEDAAGLPIPMIHVWPQLQFARYWRVDIADPTNPAGYLDVSRLVLAPGWQPSVNLSYGAQAGVVSNSVRQESLGGARFYDRRNTRRAIQFSLDFLGEDEAQTQSFDLQRRLDVWGQVMWIFDPDDKSHLFRRVFLGTLRQLDPVEYPVYGRSRANFQIEEVIS
jgi:hypothetical protein